MRQPIRTICDKCGADVGRFKFLKKINGGYYCKKCSVELRNNHREETIDQNGIREELRVLKNKQIKESFAKYKKPKQTKEENNYVPRRYRTQFKEEDIPTIKDSNKNKSKQKKLNSLTLYERQDLYRIFKSRGLEHEEAVERVNNVANQQKIIREKLIEEGKNEEEILEAVKINKQKFLKELWAN